MRNYYIAKISIRNCFADIRINDVPLIRENIEGDFTMESPINNLLESSGMHYLTVGLYPILDSPIIKPGSLCVVEIWEYDGSAYIIKPIRLVCEISLKGDVTDHLIPFKQDKKCFYSELPYNISRWGDCEVLIKDKSFSLLVANYLKYVMDLLVNKHFDKFYTLISEREKNICKSLYLDKDEIEIRKIALFESIQNGFVVEPLKGKKILQFYAGNRAVAVLDADQKSALRFTNESTGEILLIELLLGIKRGTNNLSII